MEFEFLGDYSLSPSNNSGNKNLTTNKIIANLKSLNAYMGDRFPKIHNNELKKGVKKSF